MIKWYSDDLPFLSPFLIRGPKLEKRVWVSKVNNVIMSKSTRYLPDTMFGVQNGRRSCMICWLFMMVQLQGPVHIVSFLRFCIFLLGSDVPIDRHGHTWMFLKDRSWFQLLFWKTLYWWEMTTPIAEKNTQQYAFSQPSTPFQDGRWGTQRLLWEDPDALQYASEKLRRCREVRWVKSSPRWCWCIDV